MGQDIFDLVMILLLMGFTIRGFLHGFVEEIASLVSLLGAFWAAHQYHAALAPRLTFIAEPAWRTIAAYVAIFFLVVVGVAIVARLVQKALSAIPFVPWANKVAGGMLGLAKGVLLCALILLVLQKFFADAPFMRQSRVLPYFNALMAQMHDWLPPDLTSRLGL
ncbi:MAG: CvpA family protein [Desulfovibrio sp.]|nr:CvpA family protein [Desulfovibrio sp.]